MSIIYFKTRIFAMKIIFKARVEQKNEISNSEEKKK